MKCAMCLKEDTPDDSIQLCVVCTKSLKYAEDLIKRTGVGLKITYNKGRKASIVRGDLTPVREEVYWNVEMTHKPNVANIIDLPVFEGSAGNLEDACKIAYNKLEEGLK